MPRKTFDTMVREWEALEAFQIALWHATRTNRPKSLDITTYDNSGSPYGVADVFHGTNNRGQRYNRPVFEAKVPATQQ